MKKIINIIILIVSILLFGLVIITGLIPGFILDTKIMLGCLFFPIIISFITMVIEIKISKNYEEKEILKIFWLRILFILYCLALFAVLFLDSEYRLLVTLYNKNVFSKEHLSTINIIPFKSLIDFFSNWNIKILILNIGVNLILFMPMGFFIPILFKNKIGNIKKFTLIMIIVTVIIEILQFLTYRGSTDIDDVILNVFGAILAYLFVKSRIGTKLLQKILD